MRRHARFTSTLLALTTVALGLGLLATSPASAANTELCTISGTAGDDQLIGTSKRDVICGLGGDDIILGRGGDDVLRGGVGDDVLVGGAGRDELIGGAGEDAYTQGVDEDFWAMSLTNSMQNPPLAIVGTLSRVRCEADGSAGSNLAIGPPELTIDPGATVRILVETSRKCGDEPWIRITRTGYTAIELHGNDVSCGRCSVSSGRDAKTREFLYDFLAAYH